MSAATIRVWDPFVRAFHWALALSFATAWLSAEHFERLHLVAGYVAGGLVLARVVWGFGGSHYARFAQFVRTPATIVVYLKAIGGGTEPRYLGHNPAGGAMILLLIAAMTATATTGWLLTTDAFWGSETMRAIHSALAHGVLLLVLVHVGGVALASVRHHENLIRAMVVGMKRAAGPDDVA